MGSKGRRLDGLRRRGLRGCGKDEPQACLVLSLLLGREAALSDASATDALSARVGAVTAAYLLQGRGLILLLVCNLSVVSNTFLILLIN